MCTFSSVISLSVIYSMKNASYIPFYCARAEPRRYTMYGVFGNNGRMRDLEQIEFKLCHCIVGRKEPDTYHKL